MAIWTHTGTEVVKVPWHRIGRPDRAILYGCGPSLNEAQQKKIGTRFVQNHGYKVVRPDYWIGMDQPEAFGADLLTFSCPKIFRGNFSRKPLLGRETFELPNSFFMDVEPGDLRDVFQRQRDINTKFVWAKNTMVSALHLIIWMGFKDILFCGIDLQGPYFDNRELDGWHEESVRTLLGQELQFLEQFAVTCRIAGIKLRNGSPKSKLAEFMELEEGD
jgi:hypothetical protein